MKLRTIIIDDEPIALDKLRSYVEKTPQLQLVGAFSNGMDALEMLTAAGGNEVDVIFTDINMPDINGMEMIGALPRPPLTVFITAHPDYAAESYRHSAVDYLLKPYSFADFQRAVTKVMERSQAASLSAQPAAQQPDTRPAGTGESDSIFIKVDYRYIRVNLSDISYIKGYGEYLQVYTSASPMTPILTLSSFAAIREKLSPQFIQIHRSYIVNMDHVLHIERARIVMDADTYLPVGDSYRATLQSYLATHAIGGATKKD